METEIKTNIGETEVKKEAAAGTQTADSGSIAPEAVAAPTEAVETMADYDKELEASFRKINEGDI